MQFALLGAIVLLLSQLSMLSVVSVDTVRVVGNESLGSARLMREIVDELDGYYLNLFSRRNTFLVPRGRIEKKLLVSFPRLASVNARTEGFTKFAVEVQEREEVGVYCKNEDCYFIDKNGFIFDEAPQFTDAQYLEFYGTLSHKGTPIRQRLLPEESFVALLSFINDVERAGFASESLNMQSESLYEVILKVGGRIIFDPGDDYDVIRENLALALSSDDLEGGAVRIKYIDLRFGNRIFYQLEE